MNINDFISLKNNKECQVLDNNIICTLNKLFEDTDYNKKSFNKKQYTLKKPNNILKNIKLQNKKDTITNKINLILNKLSEENINALIIEFIENINRVEHNEFNEILKAFYLKMIYEINFIKIYLLFFKHIAYIYQNIQKYNIMYFISLVETKFKLDYTDYNIDIENEFSFLKEIEGETYRNNNLTIIYNMCNMNLLSDKLLTECDNVVIGQSKYLPDIYYWINIRNLPITDNIKLMINKHLTNNLNNSRDTILLNSIIDNKNITETKNKSNIDLTSKTVNKPIIKTDTFSLEVDNILEEYLLVKSLDDVNYFIETKCIDAIIKNKFCEIFFEKYFTFSDEKIVELIELMKQLIKQQKLFKSNLSRGLLLINNNWNKNQLKYIKPKERMKNILNILKNIGITKGLELLIKNFL